MFVVVIVVVVVPGRMRELTVPSAGLGRAEAGSLGSTGSLKTGKLQGLRLQGLHSGPSGVGGLSRDLERGVPEGSGNTRTSFQAERDIHPSVNAAEGRRRVGGRGVEK